MRESDFAFSKSFKMSQLQLIFGCMQSGKSTELMRRLSRYMSYLDNVLVVNSALDTRVEGDYLSTHNTQVKTTMTAKKVLSLFDIDETSYERAHVIGLDEAQFFPDLHRFVKKALYDGKIVIVAGLDADSSLQPFGEMIQLVPLATDVVKLKACCKVCADGTEASYSHCIVKKESQIQIGDGSSYIPVCWKHYREMTS